MEKEVTPIEHQRGRADPPILAGPAPRPPPTRRQLKCPTLLLFGSCPVPAAPRLPLHAPCALPRILGEVVCRV
jgi:hypothetical protein